MSVPPSSSDETEAILENIKEDGSFDRLRQQLLSLVKASVRNCSKTALHEWSNPPPPFFRHATLPGADEPCSAVIHDV